jgi:hypothetical protein
MHPAFVILIVFNVNNSHANASQCYFHTSIVSVKQVVQVATNVLQMVL